MAKAITREKAINTIVNDIHNWDMENLIAFVQDRWAKELDKLSNTALEAGAHAALAGVQEKKDD